MCGHIVINKSALEISTPTQEIFINISKKYFQAPLE